MKFTLDIHPRAIADLDEIHAQLADYSPDAADRIYTMIKHGVLSLSDFPRRCPQAPESARASIEMRHLIVGNYRVIFTIIGRTVHVWCIRHAARDMFDPSEFL